MSESIPKIIADNFKPGEQIIITVSDVGINIDYGDMKLDGCYCKTCTPGFFEFVKLLGYKPIDINKGRTDGRCRYYKPRTAKPKPPPE